MEVVGGRAADGLPVQDGDDLAAGRVGRSPGAGSRRRNVDVGDQLSATLRWSIARTRQYRTLSTGYERVVVNVVDAVFTVSSGPEKLGSVSTSRRYVLAPSAGVHRNVGCDHASSPEAGHCGVGGVERLWNAAGCDRRVRRHAAAIGCGPGMTAQ